MTIITNPTSGSKIELRQTRRFITTNNDHCKSVFSKALSETPPIRDVGDGLQIAFNYGTAETPPNFGEEKDIEAYVNLIKNPPGIIIPDGCVARLIDMPPGYSSPMHRTISLNYNFIISGEIELILDSGETRRLLPGDMAVQRAVNHSWRNVSSSEWARMTAFAIPAIPDEKHGFTESGTGDL
ncbi:hypothetical protein B0A52_06754 [Exophiala mesophila]|uniref:Cupin type-2 domain-containing protein n=1 Tax=Exophiala mesophila TaxID=212818 RepID=A0A438N024_EXOME|nr:hypothetical protein B0A52_06754 [Exophiala mesophila]